MFPAEQARIVQLLVERVDVQEDALEVRVKAEGLASLATAIGQIEEARRRINEVPSRHPFDLRYAWDLPATAWERCAEVLDRHDVLRIMKQPW